MSGLNNTKELISLRSSYSEQNTCFVGESQTCNTSGTADAGCGSGGGRADRESFCSDQTEAEAMSSDFQTPPECMFDPFALPPDDLILAPKKMSHHHATLHHATLHHVLNRVLDFDSEESAVTDAAGGPDDEEARFSELIFSSLLELIISTKLMEISSGNDAPAPCSDRDEDFKTPTSIPLLTGISETCPPAPQRPASTPKIFDHTVCRKLDFEDCSD